MLSAYHHNPILGIYYYPAPEHWDKTRIVRDLAEVARAGLRAIWLFFDPLYGARAFDSLRFLMEQAQSVGLAVVPVLGQYLRLDEHPEVKIVNADGSTSDNPRYWNMGCFRHPTALELATQQVVGFLRDFGDHPALHRLDGKPLMAFAHEAYYRNSVPEFGGGPMMPNCYCEHCRAAFQDYLRARDLPPVDEPPRDPSDPVLWQHWLNFHAEAIPEFLGKVIAAARAQTPLWATHELNDFYPASWQSVYTGNDWWRMGAVLDFGHEDMYPLEFDHQYLCYVYDYAKDITRSAVGFDKLVTGNGQAFNSWAGYHLPDGSMSEQVYSCLAHGALGLVWWGQWPNAEPDQRYALTRQTRPYNGEYAALVGQVAGLQLARARVAVLYSWTTMCQALDDTHTYDTLLTYMMLVQSGYPVDVLSEDQVAAGLLESRGYRALLAMGCAALPDAVHAAISTFVDGGGLVIADHAPRLNAAFAPLFGQWRMAAPERLRIYTLPGDVPVPVQMDAAPLLPPRGSQAIAHFNDGSPAIARVSQGSGSVILAGSYLGWDYTNYPGYYDLAAMFPFHIRRDDALRRWLSDLLTEAGIAPPARSSHPDVEVALWQTPNHTGGLLLAINHLCERVETVLSVPGLASAQHALSGEPVPCEASSSIRVILDPLEGRAFRLAFA